MIAGSAGTYEVGSHEPGSIVDSAYLGAKTRNLLTVHSMTPRSTEFELIVSTASTVFDFKLLMAVILGAVSILYESHTVTPTGNASGNTSGDTSGHA